jgi:Eukaryotic aspartyl protease.
MTTKKPHIRKIGTELNVEFGRGSISGVICKDTVTIAGIELKSQYFAEVTKENGGVFYNGKFSGLMGLGFKKLAADNTIPIFDSIINSKELD